MNPLYLAKDIPNYRTRLINQLLCKSVVQFDFLSNPSLIPQDYSTEISTGQFQYSADEFNRLSGVTEENLVQSLVELKRDI